MDLVGLFMDINCGGELVLKLIRFAWRLLDTCLIIIPMGLIVMVMMDFAKSVIAGQEGDMKKNLNIALKRIIFAMAIFLVPFIVSAAISLLGENGVDYAVCLEIAKSKDDLAQYRTKFESDEYGNTKIVVPDSYIRKRKKKKANSLNKDSGSSNGTANFESPDWSNSKAWGANNPYSASWTGQCTWFAWGFFYEKYGYSPGFTGNGNQCAGQLVNAHPDKFELSSTPKAGAVFSCLGKNHVGVVTAVSDGKISIRDGNYDGVNNTFEDAQSDWHDYTYDLSSFVSDCSYGCCGSVQYANPK